MEKQGPAQEAEAEPLVLEIGVLEIAIHELQIELEKCEDKARRAELRRDIAQATADFNKLTKLEAEVDPNGYRPGTTYRDLMETEFAPIQWVVKDLLPVGATVLAGKPKVGKSFMALQLAQAVASGSPFLGMETSKCPVLMIALEDSPRRIKGRLLMQQAPADLPIDFEWAWEPLDGDGYEDLKKRVHAGGDHGPYGLVIVDTLASAKSASVDENKASQMAQLIYPLQRLAHEYEFGLLLIFHHRKGTIGSEKDPVWDVRGSGAVPGAVDVLIGLYKDRPSGDYSLLSESRDAPELQLRVEFDGAQTGSWHLVGNLNEIARGDAEDDILSALEDLGEADVRVIAKEIGKTYTPVWKTCRSLKARGILDTRLVKSSRGSNKLLYFLSNNDRESS